MGSPNASLAQRGQAVVPGSSPYMVPESGFRPTHRANQFHAISLSKTSNSGNWAAILDCEIFRNHQKLLKLEIIRVNQFISGLYL